VPSAHIAVADEQDLNTISNYNSLNAKRLTSSQTPIWLKYQPHQYPAQHRKRTLGLRRLSYSREPLINAVPLRR
jgi:hypothetical protein